MGPLWTYLAVLAFTHLWLIVLVAGAIVEFFSKRVRVEWEEEEAHRLLELQDRRFAGLLGRPAPPT